MDPKESKESKQEQPVASQPTSNRPSQLTLHRRATVIAVVGGLVILALGFSAGWLSRAEHAERRMGGGNIEFIGSVGPRGGGMHEFRSNGDINPTDGTEYTRLSGVVTQVNADSFVIAGNGTTKTIKTTSDTTYSTSDKKVETNDSVTVRGTQNGDTYTASHVVVLNR